MKTQVPGGLCSHGNPPTLVFWQIVPLSVTVLQPAGASSSLAAQHQAGTLCSLSYTKASLLAFHVSLFSPHKATFSLKRWLTSSADTGASVNGPKGSAGWPGVPPVLPALRHPASSPRALRHPMNSPGVLLSIPARPQAAPPRGSRDKQVSKERDRTFSQHSDETLPSILPRGSPFP